MEFQNVVNIRLVFEKLTFTLNTVGQLIFIDVTAQSVCNMMVAMGTHSTVQLQCMSMEPEKGS